MKVRRSFSVGRASTETKRPAKVKKDKPVKSSIPLKRRLLAGTGVAASSLLAGYLFAAFFVFPAPFIVRNTGVPRVIGMTLEDANQRLATDHFTGQVAASEPHATVPRGLVVWQDPPPGVAIPQGSSVQLTVSAGPSRIPVPGVGGYDVELATMLLEGAGLAVGPTVFTQTPAPRGVVMNTRPPQGEFLSPGTEVTLVVSEGAPTINVPYIIGMTLDSARVELGAAGLILGTDFFRTSPGDVPGTVVDQIPPAGTLSAPGTAINVWLARERRQ